MPAKNASPQDIIKLLTRSYNDELETVANYLANGTNLDGVRAEEIKKSLLKDVTAELGHAQTLARRIKTLGGLVPGSQALKTSQKLLQPRKDTTDVVWVIKGVIAAEEDAIAGYERIIRATEGSDWVTQDMAITILADEQEHRREFVGFLKEYQKSRA